MRVRSLLTILASIIAVSVHASAQSPTGTVSGRVVERWTGQPVAAIVTVLGLSAEAITDGEGNFSLDVTPGVFDLRATANGFRTVTRSQIAVTGGRTVVVNFKLDVTRSDTVEVGNEIFVENPELQVSSVALKREDIRAMPGTAGDPLRVINSLPAVSAASGEFADLIVRGGTSEENLTFVDNIPIPDFTYFTDKYDGQRGGRAGILPPDVFERADFSAGGFGARFGDRMSSALDIGVREPNRKRVQAVLFADSGTAGGSVDIPFGSRGGWLFSGRQSFIDVALDVAGIAEQGLIGYPRTLDFTNKFVYDFSSRHHLTFTALNFFETFDQTDEQALNIDRRTDRLTMRRTSRRNFFGTTLTSQLGSKALAKTTGWASDAHNDGMFFLPFTQFLQRSRDLRDSEFGVKEDVSISTSPSLQFAAGGGAYFDQANYHSFENTGRFFSPLEEEFNAAPRENRLQLETSLSAYGYIQGTWRPHRSLSITPGLRLDRYGVTSETVFSPRLAARYSIRSDLALTFATGVYHQPPSLFVLSLTENNRDLRSQRSTHVVAGFEWQPRDDVRVRVEAFRKTYRHLVVQPILPTANSSVDGDYFNTGSGEAIGAEVSVQKALGKFFSGQGSYAFLDSRRRYFDTGPEFASDFERPHQLTLVGISRFHGFSIAAKYRVASGLPYTRRTAVLIPSTVSFIQRIVDLTDTNALRLPTFASLDLRGEKRFGFRRWSLAPYVDIFNITNHDSVVQPNYEFYSPSPQFLTENKRLPIFGFRIEF